MKPKNLFNPISAKYMKSEVRNIDTDKKIKIKRVWAMPNKWTFKIKPIAQLLARYVGDGKGWFDPFAGENSIAEIKNDLNPERPTEFHYAAHDFLEQLQGGYNGMIRFKGVLFDPPYNLSQLKECYGNVGKNLMKDDVQKFPSREKSLAGKLIEVGGIAICCGWNTCGIGKKNGFELIEILLVSHGKEHNDTIVTVERKFRNELF